VSRLELIKQGTMMMSHFLALYFLALKSVDITLKSEDKILKSVDIISQPVS